MSTTCHDCGAVLLGNVRIREEYRSFHWTKVLYCPACYSKRHGRTLRLLIVLVCIVALMMLMSVFLALGGYGTNTAWAFANLVLFCLFMHGMILPHEWGHALFAYLLNWRVFKISLGSGRTLWQFRVAGLLYEVNSTPWTGATWIAPRRIRWLRTSNFFIILAGPAIHVAVLAVLLANNPIGEVLKPSIGEGFAPMRMFGCANLLLLVSSLFPWRYHRQFGSIALTLPSDGIALLNAPFLARSRVEAMHASLYAMEGCEVMQARQFQRAREWHENGLALYPDDVANRICLAYALYFLKDFRNARAQWSNVRQRNDIDEQTRATMQNNIAWVDLLIGEPDLLTEADGFSQDALDKAPWYAPFQGTRGSVLIELGEVNEGMPLVQSAFDNNGEPMPKALNACYLALGELKRGNRVEGDRWLGIARSLDSECVLLDKTEQQLRPTHSS